MTFWTPRRCMFPLRLRVGRKTRSEDHCGAQATARVEFDMNGQRFSLDVCLHHQEKIAADGGIDTALLIDGRPN